MRARGNHGERRERMTIAEKKDKSKELKRVNENNAGFGDPRVYCRGRWRVATCYAHCALLSGKQSRKERKKKKLKKNNYTRPTDARSPRNLWRLTPIVLLQSPFSYQTAALTRQSNGPTPSRRLRHRLHFAHADCSIVSDPTPQSLARGSLNHHTHTHT